MTTDIDPLLSGDSDHNPEQPPEQDVPIDDFTTDDHATDDLTTDGQATDDDVTGENAKPVTRSVAKSIREWMVVVVIAITAAVVMKVFVVQQFYVSGHSMDTTLHDLDRVLVNKLSYDLHDPNRGDVVVLEEGIGAAERDLIKRVIALPGETIEIKSCVVYIDDRELVEPYLDPQITGPNNCGSSNYGPLKVPDHAVFVMGDNRPNSGDSRGGLGPVDYDKIVGRAFVVIWPKDHWQWL
ncbi:MAG: signal peptidase I [Ilumatobacteraceae bacterium]